MPEEGTYVMTLQDLSVRGSNSRCSTCFQSGDTGQSSAKVLEIGKGSHQ